MTHSVHALPVGSVLAGYEIARVIGEGGFGITYEAVNPVTCYRVAIKEFFPTGLDTAAAIAACGRAAALPGAPARTLHQLGRAYEWSEAFGDARSWFDRAAGRNHAAALVSLDGMHHDGRGAPRNPDEARRLWERARPLLEERIGEGNAAAAYTLGAMHYFGRGVPRSYGEAARLIGRAAELGHANAVTAYGALHAQGRGVRQDHAEAKRW